MAKPTPEQVFEMKSRKLVKEIWEAHFNRSKDEFTSISLRANVIEIKIENRGVTIHRSRFEDYFNATNDESKQIGIQKIKDSLKRL